MPENNSKEALDKSMTMGESYKPGKAVPGQISEEAKKEMEETRAKLEKFKKYITKISSI
jgi:hypothetical protein